MVYTKENLGLFERTYLRTLNTALDYGGLAASLLSGMGLTIQNGSLFAGGVIVSMAAPVADNLFVSSTALEKLSGHKEEKVDRHLDNYINGKILRNLLALFITPQTANTYNDPTSLNILTTVSLVGLTVLSHAFIRRSKKRLTDLVESESR